MKNWLGTRARDTAMHVEKPHELSPVPPDRSPRKVTGYDMFKKFAQDRPTHSGGDYSKWDIGRWNKESSILYHALGPEEQKYWADEAAAFKPEEAPDVIPTHDEAEMLRRR